MRKVETIVVVISLYNSPSPSPSPSSTIYTALFVFQISNYAHHAHNPSSLVTLQRGKWLYLSMYLCRIKLDYLWFDKFDNLFNISMYDRLPICIHLFRLLFKRSWVSITEYRRLVPYCHSLTSAL